MSNDIYQAALEARTAEAPVADFLRGRWSPRAMTGEALTDEEVLSLFEAARWAPSAFNEQPWRMIYAKRDTPAWDKLFSLMVEFNQNWTKDAGLIIVFVSSEKFSRNDKPNGTHSFDTGSAWMSLALQASSMGLVAHGMSGFDYDLARESLGIPEGYAVEAMCAVGKLAPKDTLPAEMQEQESPSSRKSIGEITMEGNWLA